MIFFRYHFLGGYISVPYQGRTGKTINVHIDKGLWFSVRMKKMSKLIKIIVLIIIFILTLIIVPLIINIIFKMDAGIWFIQAEWTAGEALHYVASVMAAFGTIYLAYAALVASNKSSDIANKLTEENNALQRVLVQNLYPAVNIREISTTRPCECPVYPGTPDKTHSFIVTYIFDQSYGALKIYINVDVDSTLDYSIQKTISFELENASKVLIRHIAFHDITIKGYKNNLEPIVNENSSQSDFGKAIVLSPGQRMRVEVVIYCSNQHYIKAWENPATSLSLLFRLTNTSISGVKFNQYIEVDALCNGLSRVMTGTFDLE